MSDIAAPPPVEPTLKALRALLGRALNAGLPPAERRAAIDALGRRAIAAFLSEGLHRRARDRWQRNHAEALRTLRELEAAARAWVGDEDLEQLAGTYDDKTAALLSVALRRAARLREEDDQRVLRVVP